MQLCVLVLLFLTVSSRIITYCSIYLHHKPCFLLRHLSLSFVFFIYHRAIMQHPLFWWEIRLCKGNKELLLVVVFRPDLCIEIWCSHFVETRVHVDPPILLSTLIIFKLLSLQWMVIQTRRKISQCSSSKLILLEQLYQFLIGPGFQVQCSFSNGWRVLSYPGLWRGNW